MVDRQRILDDLRRLGLREGDHVLTHSSLKSLGQVDGGAETVIGAIRTCVGPTGTAIFPTHTWAPGQGPDTPPAFNARTSPSVVGLISETARRTPGGVRSLSPTHSVVAFGGQAEFITGGHHRSPTPVGSDSPYDRLGQVGGKILLLGVDHERNTTLHMMEELLGFAYHMIPGAATYDIFDADGNPVTVTARFHLWGAPRNFNGVEPMLLAEGAQVNGTVGNATARLVDAARMRELVLARLAEDPDYLLEKSPDA